MMESWQMDHPVFVVPGIGNSGPLHWQSVWQAAHPDWRRLVVEDWDQVVCDDWVSAIERQVAESGEDTVIVAHSLGCLAVVHWAGLPFDPDPWRDACRRAGPGHIGISRSSRNRICAFAIGAATVSYYRCIQLQRPLLRRSLCASLR